MDTPAQVFSNCYQTPPQLANSQISELSLPVPCTLKPVQNVSAAGVVNLIEGMWV